MGSEAPVPTASGRREPSLREVLLMLAAVFAAHLLAVCRVKSFWEVVASWGDNQDYLDIVTMLRQGHFSGGPLPSHFWGFPYAIAAMSKLFSMPELLALVMISMLASVAVCILVHRLYGGWVAAATLVFLNYQWILTCIEGGSEPLFVCLLYASFLAARSGRWTFAAALASLSTTVRPVGVFALVSFAAVLAWRKSYRQLAAITCMGLAVGVLYVVPVWMILGNPLASFTAYRDAAWAWDPHGWLVTLPFRAVVSSYVAGFHDTRWTVLVICTVWPVIALTGMAAMWLPRGHQRFLPFQQEAVFASMYTLFLLTFNAPEYIVWSLPRYLIPVVPLLFFALRDWIPRDRRALWGSALLSAWLAAAAVVSFKNVFGFRLP